MLSFALLCLALRETTRQFVGQFVGRGAEPLFLGFWVGLGPGCQVVGWMRFSCVFSRFFLFLFLYYAFQPSGDVPQNVYESFCKVFAKFLVSLKREPFLSGGYELGLSWDRLFEFLGLDIPTWLKRIIQK